MVTFTGYPTDYSQDYACEQASSQTNGCTDSSSTTYSNILLTYGSNTITYFYYVFDTSSIPQNVTINAVRCTCKASVTNTGSNRVKTRQIQMSSGTTLKGNPTSLTTSATVYTMDVGTWTRGELDDTRIRLYAVRGGASTSSNYYLRMYGADLEVDYTEVTGNKVYIKISGTWEEANDIMVKDNGSWKSIYHVYKKDNGTWTEKDKSAVFVEDKTYIKG